MEQQLDATYLRPSSISKACGFLIAVVGTGASILLATYGISLFWRPVPPVMDVRIANPELIVKQDRPFLTASPAPSQSDPITPASISSEVTKIKQKNRNDGVTAKHEEIIQREVIVFSTVKHGDGAIITGWRYANGSGQVPIGQFCYYSSQNANQSSMRVDIAFNRTPLSESVLSLVPDSGLGLAKCQWWRA
jgi:hypothetical protein